MMDARPDITVDEILKVDNMTVAFGEFKASRSCPFR